MDERTYMDVIRENAKLLDETPAELSPMWQDYLADAAEWGSE